MHPINFYKFCPKCAGELKQEKENLLVCSDCKFQFYINALPCNGVIIENEKGEILLVKRKFDPQKGKWDYPGGFIDGGESLEHSVKREVKEELNVEVEMLKLVGVYEDIYKYQNILNPSLCIVVSVKITSGELKVSDDVKEYKFFPPEEILGMDLAFKNIRKGLLDYLKNK